MSPPSLIPVDLESFLPWLRDRTEAAWANYETAELADFKRRGVGGTDWQKGTRWLGGFDPSEIEKFQKRWGLLFPPDYRRFLEILGAPDRPLFSAAFTDGDELTGDHVPSFLNWMSDEEAIEDALRWPYEGLEFDLEHNDLWLESWGPKPKRLAARKKVLAELVESAPPLIPIMGHRYLLGEPVAPGNPVLSVYQSDIIVYGSTLRSYLLADLGPVLGLTTEEAEAAQDSVAADISNVPFWGEIMSLY